MRFWTDAECQAWCESLARFGLRLDDRSRPGDATAEKHHVKADIPQSFTRLTWFCQHLEQSLRPREECLLWVTDWGIWSENLHLYYKLRQWYQDHRLLEEAPGHLFLAHERVDLVSFLQVGILCGWDMHLVAKNGYARAFVSHDEWVAFASDDNNPGLVDEFAKPLTPTASCDTGTSP